MKKSKLKLITKILAIIIICLISFIGIYVQKNNNMQNIIKGYELSKDLTGYREIIFELSNATEVLDKDGKVVGNTDQYDDETIKSNSYKKSDSLINNEEEMKKENYELTKKIIEKRLDLMGVEDYNISLDTKTGKMYLQIPEDDNSDYVVSNILEIGSFEIKDSKEGTVYLTRQHLKKANIMYGSDQTGTGTIVYLQMQLNKEGTSILKDLSENQYAKLPEKAEEENTVSENQTNETVEEDKKESKETTEETKQEETQKEIVLSISGSDMVTTSFDDPIVDGIISLSMNSASTDNDQINTTLRTASTYVTVLESGELPLLYKVTQNQYVTTDLSETMIKNTIIITGVVLAILLVFMIVKNKLSGLLGVISYIGFIALYLLLIRYTNVIISISGAIGIVLIFILNYIFNMKLLAIDSHDKKTYKEEYLKLIAKIIPIFIISIIFIFMKWVSLSSLGMIVFWGLSLMMIYNIVVTKNIVN